MSKSEWYGNYGYVPLKDNFEEVGIKKEILQRKFVQACAKKSSDYEIVSKNIETKKFSEDKKIDAKEEAYLLEIQKLKNIIKEQKQTISKVQKDCEKIKKSRFQYAEEIKARNAEINDWKNKFEKLSLDYENEKKQMYLLNKEINKLKNSKDKRENHNLKGTNSKLSKKLSLVSKELEVANKQLQNYQIIRNGETESDALKKCKLRLVEKEKEVDNIKGKLIVATATVNALNGKLLRKKRELITSKKEAFDKSMIVCENKSMLNMLEDIEFGFISLNKDNELIVIDIHNKRYKISALNDLRRLEKYIGMPVRVVKLNNAEKEVRVDYIYYNLSKGAKVRIINKSSKFKLRAKAKDSFVVKDEFKDKKILIVGSMNKSKYINSLIKTGAKIIWHESFSDNESRIGDIAPSCDVVVVCTSHISHTVTYKINSLSDYVGNKMKYQMIEHDNVNNIISRIRYSLENQ